MILAGQGLCEIDEAALEDGFQVDQSNPFIGIAARVKLLNALGRSLLSLPEIFGEDGRPGNLVGTLFSMHRQCSFGY